MAVASALEVGTDVGMDIEEVMLIDAAGIDDDGTEVPGGKDSCITLDVIAIELVETDEQGPKAAWQPAPQ